MLICGVNGTPPVTFKWYRSDEEYPIVTVTSNTNNTHFEIPVLYRKDSGRYRCEAVNNANDVVSSDFVDIHGEKTTGFFSSEIWFTVFEASVFKMLSFLTILFLLSAFLETTILFSQLPRFPSYSFLLVYYLF